MASSASLLQYEAAEEGCHEEDLGPDLIVLAFAGGCARKTVVNEPAASPPTTVVVPGPTPPVVVKYDNRAACEAAGGR
jgi:hypothetical protein